MIESFCRKLEINSCHHSTEVLYQEFQLTLLRNQVGLEGQPGNKRKRKGPCECVCVCVCVCECVCVSVCLSKNISTSKGSAKPLRRVENLSIPQTKMLHPRNAEDQLLHPLQSLTENEGPPGGPVAKTPHSHCRGSGFDPWSGNQSSRTTAEDPMCRSED